MGEKMRVGDPHSFTVPPAHTAPFTPLLAPPSCNTVQTTTETSLVSATPFQRVSWKRWRRIPVNQSKPCKSKQLRASVFFDFNQPLNTRCHTRSLDDEVLLNGEIPIWPKPSVFEGLTDKVITELENRPLLLGYRVAPCSSTTMSDIHIMCAASHRAPSKPKKRCEPDRLLHTFPNILRLPHIC